jgi:Xaa-Pro aminopeptidase
MKDFSRSSFHQRRQALALTMDAQSVAVICSSTKVFRNRDVHYPFRQNSDFWYLTGFPEPDAIAVLHHDGETMRYLLFCQPDDAHETQWHGPRAGLEGACEHYGADEAYALHDFDQTMATILADASALYCLKMPQITVGVYQHSLQSGALAQCRLDPRSLEDHLYESRLIKSEDEIAYMRHAAQISAQAHCAGMRASQPGLYEYEVMAAINYELRRHGCLLSAYDAIVGGGANGCILHYMDNNSRLVDGDLLLVDAGGEYQYYAADITRTYPVNGKFTPEQRALYEVVLAAQQGVIDQVKPGVTWEMLQHTSARLLTEGMVELGILKGSVEDLLASGDYKRFYMHGIGHWLGLDVHDVGAKQLGGKPRPFEANMVITVEPGIYIAPGSQVDERWHGMAVRIEDDIAVTHDGYDILSDDVPKTIEGIEAIMASSH